MENAAQDRRVTIYRRAAGHFTWVEEHFTVLDETAFGGDVHEYWAPGWDSGLYETLEEALKGAADELPWLRAMRH